MTVDSKQKRTSERPSQSYRGLLVWQKGMDFVVEIYAVCQYLPKEEIYGLKSQLQRAAVSVPSNIAEGQARGVSSAEFARFIRMALGSLAEVDTQLELAIRLGYLSSEQVLGPAELGYELRKMLFGLLKKLK